MRLPVLRVASAQALLKAPVEKSSEIKIKLLLEHFANMTLNSFSNGKVSMNAFFATTTTILRDFSAVGLVHRRQLLTNFLKVYFDASYFLFCCPFRLVPLQNNGFTTKSWMPHRILCAFTALSSALFILYEIVQSIPSNSRNPSAYFEFVSWIFDLISILCTINQFWRNQQGFVNIMNYIVEREGNHVPVPDSGLWFLKKKFILVICLICIGFSVGIGVGEGDELSHLLAGMEFNWNFILRTVHLASVSHRFSPIKSTI